MATEVGKNMWLPHTPSSGRSIISLIDINDSCIDLVYLIGNFACSFMLWNFRRYLHSQYRAMMLNQMCSELSRHKAKIVAALTCMLCCIGLCGGGLSLLVFGELCSQQHSNID